MADYKPQSPEEHFAMQRANRTAEVVKTVFDAQQKGQEANRNANERFYNSLAVFSSGTVALSITYLGYLKSVSQPIQHPHWIIACWICLLVCIVCSLFWLMFYGRYTHFFLEQQTANAQKVQCETEAKEYPTLARNSMSLQTKAMMSAKEIQDFVSNRMEAAAIFGKRAAGAERCEKRSMFYWRSLGLIAQLTFMGGFALLIAFAVKNT